MFYLLVCGLCPAHGFNIVSIGYNVKGKVKKNKNKFNNIITPDMENRLPSEGNFFIKPCKNIQTSVNFILKNPNRQAV
jgi:hypothetical protein